MAARQRALTLEELLRRARREELLPLAATLGVATEGLGRDALAARVERALRRRGQGLLGNLLWPRGAAYPTLLRRLARRRGAEVATDPEATEQLLLAHPGAPRPSEVALLAAIAEIAALRAVVARRVTIGLTGSPSVGKDACARAVFGIDTGEVSPVAGSTRAVRIDRVAGGAAIDLLNTPGLGDLDPDVDREAREVLQHVDVHLFLVNAQGGVQARERAEWARVRSTGRPALVVVNKIDTLRPEDRARLVADVAEKLGVPPEQVLPAAFDPLPELVEGPIGVEAVRAWVDRVVRALRAVDGGRI